MTSPEYLITIRDRIGIRGWLPLSLGDHAHALGGMDVEQILSVEIAFYDDSPLHSTRTHAISGFLTKSFIAGFFFGHLFIPAEKSWLFKLARSPAFGLPS